MEYEMIINFCWFVGGATTYKILEHLFSLGTALNIYNRTLNGCIVMLKKVDEQRLVVLKEKHNKLEEDNIPKDEIEKQKKLDVQSHHIWREMMIKIILVTCPKFLEKNITFKDWESAMNLLKK